MARVPLPPALGGAHGLAASRLALDGAPVVRPLLTACTPAAPVAHGFWPIDVDALVSADDDEQTWEARLEPYAQLLKKLMRRGYAFQLMGRDVRAPYGLDTRTLQHCYVKKAPFMLLCMVCMDGPEQWPWRLSELMQLQKRSK
jgi:hypothetical protein